MTDARLQRLLGGDALASLRKRLRQRFERAPLDTCVESIRIGKLTVDEHATLASLLGRPQRYSSSLQIDVGFVDDVFRSSGIATSLRNALEQLDGPIAHIATERLQLRNLWSDTIDGRSHPGLMGLLQSPAGMGLLKRLARRTPSAAIQLCRSAEAVLQRLPAKGITRSQLAAEVLGDAHALDNGRAVATLVLAVWRRAIPPDYSQEDNSLTEPVDDCDALPGGAERSRDIWAKAGVLVNELARPALFLNLPGSEGGNYGRPLGEPAYAPLRSLLRTVPSWDVANRTVYVCENPNLLAIAADRWGLDCAPLVCTEGMPAAAQRCLLSQLAQARARLCYHGDFDWPGLRIGNHVIQTYGAEPWRFGAVDYVAAVRNAPGIGSELEGNAVAASWDDELTMTMQQSRVAISEEAVASSLLEDLGSR